MPSLQLETKLTEHVTSDWRNQDWWSLILCISVCSCRLRGGLWWLHRKERKNVPKFKRTVRIGYRVTGYYDRIDKNHNQNLKKTYKISLYAQGKNGHRDKFRCYRRFQFNFHDQSRSSDNFENLVVNMLNVHVVIWATAVLVFHSEKNAAKVLLKRFPSHSGAVKTKLSMFFLNRSPCSYFGKIAGWKFLFPSKILGWRSSSAYDFTVIPEH